MSEKLRARVDVPYERQTLGHPNPAARYAHARRLQTGLALTQQAAGQGACVLDFGAGSGAFLAELGLVRPDLARIAVEPFMRLAAPGVWHETNLEPIGAASVDALTCFEVLEHLDDAVLSDTLAGFGRVVKPGGLIIVSVPIMQGAALPMKELSRALLFRRPSDHTMGELVTSAFGKPAPRAADRLRSHKGFSHRAIERLVAERFNVLQRLYSPFPHSPWWLNSQVFWIMRRPGAPVS